MSQLQGIHRSWGLNGRLGGNRGCVGRMATDPPARRARRVILLLVLLCLLNAFDLACTITVHKLGAFHEANPVARYVLQYPNLVVLFKAGMVGFAASVFFVHRHRRCVQQLHRRRARVGRPGRA